METTCSDSKVPYFYYPPPLDPLLFLLQTDQWEVSDKEQEK